MGESEGQSGEALPSERGAEKGRIRVYESLLAELLAPVVEKRQDLPQLDWWLKNWFKQHPNAGSKDRAWLNDRLFFDIRSLLFFSNATIPHGPLSPDTGLAVDTVEGADPVSPREYLRKWASSMLASLAHKSPGTAYPLSELAEGLPAEGTPADSATVLRPPHPLAAWFAPLCRAREAYSPGWTDAFCKDLALRPPVWLRYPQARSGEVLQTLKNEGYEVVPGPLPGSACVMASEGKRLSALKQLPLFLQGDIEIQDIGSQLILGGIALPAKVPQPPKKLFQSRQQPQPLRFWDACAGAGGKTLQLAQLAGPEAVVLASDIRDWKLHDLQHRAQRAGMASILPFTWDATEALEYETLPQSIRQDRLQTGPVVGFFDLVLVDAPCTSSGTWRRSPDAVFRLDTALVEDIAQVQAEILAAVRYTVRVGGLLVYATCSWLVQENEDQVERFLSDCPEFSLVGKELLGYPEVDGDTYFRAVFRRERL